jgi:hypothetical protein
MKMQEETTNKAMQKAFKVWKKQEDPLSRTASKWNSPANILSLIPWDLF